MAYQKAPLKLDTKDVILVKPSKPTPSILLSLSTLDNIPDYNSLCQTVHVYQSANHDSPNSQLDPAFVIKEALSKALLYYYPLAGRLAKHADGKLGINCNADGVPFMEASADCDLSSLHYLDGSDTEIAKHLVFDISSQDEENGYQEYPLVFKVTKFQCGGFTIGMGASHAVVDGTGASQFIGAIAELASGKSEPSVKPVWERERLVGSRSISTQPTTQNLMGKAISTAVSPFLPTTVLMHGCFKVDSDSIRRLKLSLMKEISGTDQTVEESFTTFESLAAYVWRSRAKALELSNDGKTLMIFAVGVRRRLDPPLPDGYYGNAIVDTIVMLTVSDLIEKPLSEVVKLIRASKNVAFTCDFIRDSINTWEIEPEYFDIEGVGASTTLHLTEWKHLGFLEKVDFGWKGPVNIVPAPSNLFGSEDVCLLLPPNNLDPSMKGGVRVFISLPRPAMPKFREEMEALRLIKP